MFLILGTSLNPLFEGCDLLLCQFVVRIGRRHFFIRIVGGDAVDEFTVREVAGSNSGGATLQFPVRICLAIQPQVSLACGAIGSVALVAVVGKDGANVAIEAEWRGTGDRGEGQNEGQRSHFLHDAGGWWIVERLQAVGRLINKRRGGFGQSTLGETQVVQVPVSHRGTVRH